MSFTLLPLLPNPTRNDPSITVPCIRNYAGAICAGVIPWNVIPWKSSGHRSRCPGQVDGRPEMFGDAFHPQIGTACWWRNAIAGSRGPRLTLCSCSAEDIHVNAPWQAKPVLPSSRTGTSLGLGTLPAPTTNSPESRYSLFALVDGTPCNQFNQARPKLLH